jgi:hypothetical protein
MAKEKDVVRVCAVTWRHWVALLAKREPDKDMPLGFNIEVTLFREARRVASYSFLPRRLYQGAWTHYPVSGRVRSYDYHAGCLPKRESESAHLFILATEELGRYLLDGGSVREWVEKPEPPDEASTVPGRRRKPEEIVIGTGPEVFIMWSESYFMKGRKAPSTWVTLKFQDRQSASA